MLTRHRAGSPDVAPSGPLGGRCCRVTTRGQRGSWASSMFLGLLKRARSSQGIVCGVGLGVRGGEGCVLVPELSRTWGWHSTSPNTPAPSQGARGGSCPSASPSSRRRGPWSSTSPPAGWTRAPAVASGTCSSNTKKEGPGSTPRSPPAVPPWWRGARGVSQYVILLGERNFPGAHGDTPVVQHPCGAGLLGLAQPA